MDDKLEGAKEEIFKGNQIIQKLEQTNKDLKQK